MLKDPCEVQAYLSGHITRVAIDDAVGRLPVFECMGAEKCNARIEAAGVAFHSRRRVCYSIFCHVRGKFEDFSDSVSVIFLMQMPIMKAQVLLKNLVETSFLSTSIIASAHMGFWRVRRSEKMGS